MEFFFIKLASNLLLFIIKCDKNHQIFIFWEKKFSKFSLNFCHSGPPLVTPPGGSFAPWTFYIPICISFDSKSWGEFKNIRNFEIWEKKFFDPPPKKLKIFPRVGREKKKFFFLSNFDGKPLRTHKKHVLKKNFLIFWGSGSDYVIN